MLIGFAGASCSGKTTLVNAVYKELKERGYDVTLIKEVARWVFEEYFRSYNDLDELRLHKDTYCRFQRYICDEQMRLENELLYQYDIVLTDRTVFDNLLYAITYCDIRDVFKLFKTLPAIGRERYDIIFLCMPVNAKTCMGGFRSQKDIEFRDFHSYILYNWIAEWDNALILPSKMDLKERVHYVINVIQEHIDLRQQKS